MSDLIAITYADEASGRGAFEELDRLQKMEVLTLEDAALAIKDQKGKVKVKQTLENAQTGSAALWGGFWGLLIGLLFLAPIFWGLMGALLGAIMGKATDLGIDNKFIKQVGDSLDPGGSALFLLVVKATPDKVLPELQKYGGTVYQTSLSNEDEANLKKALEHDQVSASADEMLELE
ncbi:MAG: hypothetical protein AMJ56_07975 [Anaerolineae bacterium SG8_19]|jgi:uncharacterized membrane protein|nr:MAG: hypothetical protein AMJ56_07975 [Anaerolineae bacterium SG8_19]